MDWKMEIRKVDNGYVLKYVPDGSEIEIEEIFEENPKDEKDKEHVINMLWQIVEHFAEYNNKYDKKDIYIEFRDRNE